MKVLATLLLSLSLPVFRVAPTSRKPEPADLSRTTQRRHGTWYLAENGHAIFCYGPVYLITDEQGQLLRVATFCADGQTMVPLKD